MPNALLSVSDKTGVAEFAHGLTERGWRIISTGGTSNALREAGVAATPVSDLTGFPEILSGRVKTLHPAIHAGLLARMSLEADVEELSGQGFEPIELVAVNLYPFRETIARPSTTLADALEQIDIGGPTMLRAAAKNHEFVWPVCDPADYTRVLAALDSGRGGAANPADPAARHDGAAHARETSSQDGPPRGLRRELAAKVFSHTAAYDAAVAGYLGDAARRDANAGGADAFRDSGTGNEAGTGAPSDPMPETFLCSLARVQSLRYGENPDQAAAFYRDASRPPWGIPALSQLHGKELSFNNLLDVDGALLAIAPFLGEERPTCAILKHTTPCGVAVGRTVAEAFQRALACDPISAFGSTVVFNESVTEAAAEAVSELFVECIVAPGFATDGLRLLQRKKNLRILAPLDGARLGRPGHPPGHMAPGIDARGVAGGLLLQTSPAPAAPRLFRESVSRVAGQREPESGEWDQLAFAWAAIQSVKSNAIVLAREGATIGIGAGQMSRVDSVNLAVHKAIQAGLETDGAVLASDAFFPFRDGVDAAAAAGVRAIVQPGGSIRDEEVIEAADEHGIAMVFTGRRLFRH